jgi:hypothetical protein
MALSNQSGLLVFFSPWQFNLKSATDFFPTQQFRRWLAENGLIPEDDLLIMAKSRKMTYREWRNPGRWLTVLRMAKSWKMTYREWPYPGIWLTEIGKIPAYDKPELAWSRNIKYRDLVSCQQVNLLNLNRGIDETSNLGSSSGDKQFLLVVSRNWYESLNWISGDWKIPVSLFDWIKLCQKSERRCK